MNISLSNPDEQCAYNRSGILCGANFSLVLATSHRKECSNLNLLLLIPFALAGILLIALTLNITVTTGNIHGLIFYANVVASNRVALLWTMVSTLFKGYEMDQEHKVHWFRGRIPCSIHSQASLLGGTAPLCSDCS